jgi:hypothetical protein
VSSNPDAAACDSHNNRARQFRGMMFNQLRNAVDLFINAQLHQPDDGAVRQPANKDQLTEVLILGHKHSILLKRESHEALVARPGVNGEGGQHVVPLTDQE